MPVADAQFCLPFLVRFTSSLPTNAITNHSLQRLSVARVRIHDNINGLLIANTTLANDAAAIPPSNPSHGSYHWTFERIISAGLVPLSIAPFAAGSLNPITDAVLCGAILVHSHIGFESMITDYIPTRRLPKTRKAFDWGLKLATVVVGVGLYEFETNDVGVTEAIRRVWTA